jgi:hypothetical protein
MIARGMPLGHMECVLLKIEDSPENTDTYKKHKEERDRIEINIRYFPYPASLCFL